MRKKRKEWGKSLNNRLMGLIVLCGIVPVLFIVLFVTSSYRQGIIEKTESMVESEMKYVTSLISGRLNHAIEICKAATYDEEYEDAWIEYHSGEKSENVFYERVKKRLDRMFQLDQRYDALSFYEVNQEGPFCYSARQESTYFDYMEKIDPTIQEFRQQDCSDTQIFVISGRIFIVRNLYTDFENEKFGTLAIEMNVSRLFHDIKSQIAEETAIYLDQSQNRVMIHGNIEGEWQKEIEEKLLEKFDQNQSEQYISIHNLEYSGYMRSHGQNDYNLGIIYMSQNKQLYIEVYEFYKAIIFIILIMIPLLIYVFYFLRLHISEPITKMIEASKAIERGAIGTVVQDEKMPNIEFEYLREAFNKMSKQVKYLFDYAYDEKMARKDAKIMALQAQINPHFLNNTLEMMNWQARMSGNLEVSSMIESLGVVLDYNMNRESKRLTTLSRELRCADAYFHIISKRFGKRLTVEKEIDQKLLPVKVPQLVLQPMIENAVVHGIEQIKQGMIKIKIYSNAENLYLQVINSGKPITKDVKEKIETLLNQKPEEVAEGRGHHVSLAIRNINERVKLIYGEQYGLRIEQKGEYIVSTITIPMGEEKSHMERDSRENVRKRLEETGRF